MLVGLTGGMGAGKSTLANLLAERGALVVDADRIGHEMLARPAVKRRLAESFGADILDDDGRVVRPALAQRAFADADAVALLNRIVGGPLNDELWSRVSDDRGDGDRIVIVDAALLVEWGMHDRFDAIVVVTVGDDETVLERLERGRGLARRDVEQRLGAQGAVDDKVAVADYLIPNDGDLASLATRAVALWQELDHRRQQMPRKLSPVNTEQT